MCVMNRFSSKPYPRKQTLVRYVAALNAKDLKNIDIDDDYTFVHQRDAWNWIHSKFGYNSKWKVFECTFTATIKESKRPKECPKAQNLPKHVPDPNSQYVISHSPGMALFLSEPPFGPSDYGSYSSQVARLKHIYKTPYLLSQSPTHNYQIYRIYNKACHKVAEMIPNP